MFVIIDFEVFVWYFGGLDICFVLKVLGCMFFVEIEWFKNFCGFEVVDEYEIKVIEKVVEIYKLEFFGDILVFLIL